MGEAGLFVAGEVVSLVVGGCGCEMGVGGLVVRDVHLEQLVRALAGQVPRLLLERQANPGPQHVVVRRWRLAHRAVGPRSSRGQHL